MLHIKMKKYRKILRLKIMHHLGQVFQKLATHW